VRKRSRAVGLSTVCSECSDFRDSIHKALFLPSITNRMKAGARVGEEIVNHVLETLHSLLTLPDDVRSASRSVQHFWHRGCSFSELCSCLTKIICRAAAYHCYRQRFGERRNLYCAQN
jgi:hypothetical protein